MPTIIQPPGASVPPPSELTSATPLVGPAASVLVSVRVDASIDRAFHVFTAEIGTWWPRSNGVGQLSVATAIIEPRVGGRWYEIDEHGGVCEWGIVLVWEPPRRVVLSWHLGGAGPEQAKVESSRVDVQFTALDARSTQVDLRHTGLEVHREGWHSLRDRLAQPRVTRAA
jgi:uncharacterized protein YndB with AHSA1/START domain